jgi:hypothetical protein
MPKEIDITPGISDVAALIQKAKQMGTSIDTLLAALAGTHCSFVEGRERVPDILRSTGTSHKSQGHVQT